MAGDSPQAGTELVGKGKQEETQPGSSGAPAPPDPLRDLPSKEALSRDLGQQRGCSTRAAALDPSKKLPKVARGGDNISRRDARGKCTMLLAQGRGRGKHSRLFSGQLLAWQG